MAVLGPRQSGKTTLTKKVFPKKQYISMEDLDNREFASQDPKSFLKTYNSGAIFDEVQNFYLTFKQKWIKSEKKDSLF